MSKAKYNDVEAIMQCIKTHSHCSIHELSAELSRSDGTISGMLHGCSFSLSHYISFVSYLLNEMGFVLDFSEVSEVLSIALEKDRLLGIGVFDEKGKVMEQWRFILIKKMD